MPWSGMFLYQETLCRGVSCRRRLRWTAPCGTPGITTQLSSSSISPTLLVFPYLLQVYLAAVLCTFSTLAVSFIIGMQNRSCILKLRSNQCFVCNFFSMHRCHCQITPKKTQSVSCLACNFRNMLTPTNIVCDS